MFHISCPLNRVTYTFPRLVSVTWDVIQPSVPPRVRKVAGFSIYLNFELLFCEIFDCKNEYF